MAAAFADLTSVPMSDVLAATLARAAEYARAVAAPAVTAEHMLMSLTDDPDASVILAASQIDIHRVQQDMADWMSQPAPADVTPGEPGVLGISDDFRRILEAASLAASGGRRRDIDGAIVLAAIVGDEHTIAAERLKDQGLTFDAAIKALQGMLTQSGSARAAPASQAALSGPLRAEDVLASARERVQSRAAPGLPAMTRAPAAPTVVFAEPTPPAPEVAPPPSPVMQSPLMPSPVITKPALPPPVPPPIPMGMSAALPRAAIAAPASPALSISAPKSTPSPAMADPRRPPANPEPGLNGPSLASRPGPGAQRPQAQPQRRGPRTFDLTQFLDPVPRVMRARVASAVEIRIPKSELDIIVESMGASEHTGAAPPAIVRVLTVRIRSPQGHFHIEAQSPDTQWIEGRLDLMSDDFASWRWQITPKWGGKSSLEVIVSARSVGSDGSIVETGILNQPVPVRSKMNMGAALIKAAALITAIAAGWASAQFESPLLAVAEGLLGKLSGS